MAEWERTGARESRSGSSAYRGGAQVRLRCALIAVIALLPVLIASSGDNDQYLSPGEMALSPDGRSLYVLCERADQVRVVDVTTGKVNGTVHVGHIPRVLTLSPEGKRIYVSNSWE